MMGHWDEQTPKDMQKSSPCSYRLCSKLNDYFQHRVFLAMVWCNLNLTEVSRQCSLSRWAFTLVITGWRRGKDQKHCHVELNDEPSKRATRWK
jgi:hypothetical protein